MPQPPLNPSSPRLTLTKNALIFALQYDPDGDLEAESEARKDELTSKFFPELRAEELDDAIETLQEIAPGLIDELVGIQKSSMDGSVGVNKASGQN